MRARARDPRGPRRCESRPPPGRPGTRGELHAVHRRLGDDRNVTSCCRRPFPRRSASSAPRCPGGPRAMSSPPMSIRCDRRRTDSDWISAGSNGCSPWRGRAAPSRSSYSPKPIPRNIFPLDHGSTGGRAGSDARGERDTGDGLDVLTAAIEGTVALIGPSGAGKSTLANALLGEEVLATDASARATKGRHTTVHRELRPLPDGGTLIDTRTARRRALGCRRGHRQDLQRYRVIRGAVPVR